MIRKNLLEWQWSDYFSKHRHRNNLVLHMIAVPLFWMAFLDLVFDVWTGSPWMVAIVCLLLSFGLQGLGHKLEKEVPTPFLGFPDFVSRFFVEQFITFPRFIFIGEFYRSLTEPPEGPDVSG